MKMQTFYVDAGTPKVFVGPTTLFAAETKLAAKLRFIRIMFLRDVDA